MGSPKNSRWSSFLDDNLLEVVGQPANSFLWPINDHQDCSDKGSSFRNDTEGQGKLCPRKRSRDESFSKPGIKACREKMRRDRLNDRFMELSTLLETDSPPKADKSTILCDAISALNKLRDEASKMKKSNEQLRQDIKEMKIEKNEIRDEKTRLKAEKENLEQQIKAMMTMPPGFMAHPATIHAFAAQREAAKNKTVPIPGYPGLAMWQWMPPAAVDVSQDHVLRPPVA